MWEASLPDVAMWHNLATPHGQLFTFDPSGRHVLICGTNGGNINEVSFFDGLCDLKKNKGFLFMKTHEI